MKTMFPRIIILPNENKVGDDFHIRFHYYCKKL